MMKIQCRESAEQITIQVCGKLADRWVDELEKCWVAACQTHPQARVSVDLRDVSFVGPPGERLLRSMHRQGASFLAEGLLIQEIVNQVRGGSR
jgi:hypothetical protein